MNLCKYVKKCEVVFVKIKEGDINQRSKIVPFQFHDTRKKKQ